MEAYAYNFVDAYEIQKESMTEHYRSFFQSPTTLKRKSESWFSLTLIF